MPTKGTILKKLAGTAPDPRVITKDQDVSDIIKQMTVKTDSCASDYDKIYKDFEGGSLMDICERLFNWCLENVETFTEDEEKQFVSCPYTIVKRGTSDCKGYALFIGGVLDAMRRHGANLNWNYRFASYNLFEMEPHHVFVVVNKDTDDIWIDPVLGEFNYHYGYWWKKDRGPMMKKTAAVGFVDCCEGKPLAKIGSQETDLMDYLHGYELGLNNSVANLRHGTVDEAIEGILKGAVSVIPGATQALAVLNLVGKGVSAILGSGAVASRIVTSVFQLNPVGLFKAIFTGRTYNTDNYYGAGDYWYHVRGIDKGDSTHIADGEVLEGLKWFIMKTGVFISGRAHINALRNGADAYMAIHAQNPYTTIDRVRVNLAVQVVQRYMPAANVKGNWAGTVGVYDEYVTSQLEKARISDPNAQVDTGGVVSTGVSPSGVVPGSGSFVQSAQSWVSNNKLLSAAILAAVIFIIVDLDN